MNLIVDPDVKAVLEFMQTNIPASKLRNVARGVDELTDLIWGHIGTEEVALMRLKASAISHDDPHTQSSANEHRLVA